MARPAAHIQRITIVLLVLISIATLCPFAISSIQYQHSPYFLDSPRSQTHYVGGDGPNNYSKIQDAVDNASAGDRIYVYQGIYYEHVLITKKLALIGESRDQTIIDGDGNGNVVKILSNGVVLTQFSLQHGGIGVYIVSSSNNSVIQNSITYNWEGVGLLNASHCLISDNTIAHNFFEGINPDQTTLTTIQNNLIVDHLQGIYLVDSTENTVVGNVLRSNSRAIELQETSNNNDIFHNNFFSSEQDHGYDTCSNTWDDGYPSGGNYWDDYTGRDLDHDGIGDTPYSIPGGGGNKDYYPLMSAWQHPPYQPDDPVPQNGAVNVPVNPLLSVFVDDVDQETMNVSFYDAETHQLIGIDRDVVSSTRASVPWIGLQNMTEYSWYAVADDGSSTNQSETWEFTTGNGTNQPPTTPTINGTTSGKTGQNYTYTFLAADPDGTTVSYYIDWGDSTNSGWIGPFESGLSITVSHTWTKRGAYTIKAKAKDVSSAESDWGILSIKMPKSHTQMMLPFKYFFEKFLERFPNVFPILRNLFYL